jgi:hypothetical protein
MFLQQLFEAINKQHAAFCFGRMNPPTVGHGQLVDTVAQSAAGGDYFIFTSQTQDAKKNPLDYATKVKFIKAMFPQQANHVVYDPSLKTIMQVAAWLYNKGYRKVTFVAGSDRLENFKELLTKYNGVEGPAGMYKFDSIDFVSSGERDPDADGIAGVSASAAREAAKAGNLDAFAQATGAGNLAQTLYNAVRKGMLVEGLGNWLRNKFDPNNIPGFTDIYIKIKPYVVKDIINKVPKDKFGAPAMGFGLWAMASFEMGNHDDAIKDSVERFLIQILGKEKAYRVVQNKKLINAIITQLQVDITEELYNLKKKYTEQNVDEGWKGALAGAALIGGIGGAMYAQPQPYVEIDGVNWRLTSRTPGILAHPKVVTAADGKKYQIWRGAKNRHLAHPIDDKQVDEGASGYIPKNKREAKDPRWSHALTVDVKSDTPNKNMKALRLK